MTIVAHLPQVIDVNLGSLQEVITFPGKEYLIVNSSLVASSVGNARLQYKLEEATLQLPDRILKLPASGEGW